MPNPTSQIGKRIGDEIVRAGAGAGKTYTLTHRVMDLADHQLANANRFPRVIVTTFTRKATQELRERLMLLALESRPHLVDFVNSRSHLVVSTIHGIMDLYLKRYGANICVDPGYTVINGAQATKLSRQILRQIVLKDEASGGLLETFPFNRMADLVRRLDSIFTEHDGARPHDVESIEALFQKHARSLAKDLDDVADSIRAESTKSDWLENAEAFSAFAKLLNGDWIKNRQTLLAALEGLKTARRNAKNPPVSDETADRAQVVRDRVKDLADPVFDPEVWEKFAQSFDEIQKLAKEFSQEFQKQKKERGWLEISDLELKAMECIRKYPESAKAFATEWDFWLIDEYQDTSPFQVDLLRELIGKQPSFIVGDPQQSIYLFRGARSEVFGEKEKEIETRGGQKRLLSMNRRSAPELLLFLNDFFTRMNPPFLPMEPFVKEGHPIQPSKRVATIYPAAPDREVELGSVVAYANQLIAAGAKPEDICVLGRTNRVLQDVAERLAAAGLPTHVHAASGFFERREIRDALAILKFLANPHDTFNLVELLRSPWFRVPDRTLAEITMALKRGEASLWDRLQAQNSMSDELNAVPRLSRWLELSFEESLSGAFRKALVDCGFVDLSHVHDASGRRESNVWKLLSKLEMEEAKSGFNPLTFINNQIYEEKVDVGNSEGDAVAAIEPARINLMTVHSSKGLEFRHVIVPRLEQRPRLTYAEDLVIDPSSKRWAVRIPYGENSELIGSLAEKIYLESFRESERAEHARVLYVALTRAIDSIYLSWTGSALSGSWGDLIRLDLSVGEHKAESYSYTVINEPLTFEAAAAKEKRFVKARAPWDVEPKVDNALKVIPDTLAPKPMSVSELIERMPGTLIKSSQNRDVKQRLKIASDGTAIHKLMEIFKYDSRSMMNKLIEKWFPDRIDDVAKAIDYAASLKTPPLLEIIKNGEVEWGFAMIEHGLLIEGQVDLWGRDDSGQTWVIDYKTGNPLSRDKAQVQMCVYSVALRKSGKVRPDEDIKLAAIYPFSREVFSFDEIRKDLLFENFGFKPTTDLSKDRLSFSKDEET